MTKEMRGSYASYIRVSTQKQGHSGLGLEAQQAAVMRYVHERHGGLMKEFKEIESGRKGIKGRPELDKALAFCRKHRCTLVIGKLDRLARDVRFFLEVIDTSKVDIAFADLSDVNPSSAEGRMVLVSMANFAEFEARRISERTKAALAAAKARGRVLGAKGWDNLRPNVEERQQAADTFAARLGHVVRDMRQRELTQRGMVDELNQLGIKTPRGGSWSLYQAQLLLKRIETLSTVQKEGGGSLSNSMKDDP